MALNGAPKMNTNNLESKSKFEQIREEIKKESPKDFLETHLLAVEKFAKELIKKIPDANEEIIMLGVWLHDIQRIRKTEGDHAKVGALEAENIMKKYNYDEETIKIVKEMIIVHECDSESIPQNVEGKILTSADGMSHFINDFYLKTVLLGKKKFKDAEDYKKWVLEKIDRDYNKKIQFDFAKEIIQERYDLIKNFFSMD